ncbi:MAG TPA: DoxX-like family protein [Flavisolibacter sp.]|nr:DoxX-like family protein [Flavisolibacter sp.]
MYPKTKKTLHFLFTLGIAIVWLINGLICKLLNVVPRHQMIVSRILGAEHAYLFTKTIGLLEVLMAVWILSGIKHRFCTLAQIMLIAVMNTIEFILAPDLLLFGHVNALVATLFILLILINEYKLRQHKTTFTKQPNTQPYAGLS